MKRSFPVYISLLLISLLALPVQAEQSRTFGDYVVHYNAFTTNILSPKIAKLYKITRSNNRALLNISILRKNGKSTMGEPVKARVRATATNLNSQLRRLKVRELVESGTPGAVYYLAETPVNNGDTLTYEVNITPAGSQRTYTFSFQKQFVTE